MLGSLFGASLISLIEIFYFMAMTAIKKKFKTQNRIAEVQVSEFASSSTIHGVQFIFNNSRHNLVRIFWVFAFVFAFSCCIYNSRDSYWKLSVEPEMETTTNLKSIKEIPFPAVTICSPLFTKENITPNGMEFNYKFLKKNQIIKELSSDQFNYFIANLYWASPNLLDHYITARKKYTNNLTVPAIYNNHRSEVDLFPFLFESHFDVDELFFDCKFQGSTYRCSKLFKKVMAVQKICYVFNLQNHRQIFNEEISKNFDSYGRFEKQESQWSLDQGYCYNSSDQYPARATQDGSLELRMKVPKNFRSREALRYYISLPNEILTHISLSNVLYFETQKVVTFSAKSKRMDEGLRKFSPQNRECYFQDERKLKFFNSYTRSNCMYECFTNYTLKLCDCVAFVLPHNNQTKICDSPNESDCYYKRFVNFPDIDDSLIPCGCLPTCNDIEYTLNEDENSLKTKIKK
jgi:acid-sensing ion channel, other